MKEKQIPIALHKWIIEKVLLSNSDFDKTYRQVTSIMFENGDILADNVETT